MTDIAWRAQRYVDFSSDRSEAAAISKQGLFCIGALAEKGI